MANFTPQMLSALLSSPDPQEQELARQKLSELGMVNFPSPAAPPVIPPFSPVPEIPEQPPANPPVMTNGSEPIPVGGNAFEQAAMRRSLYGPGDSSPMPSGTGSWSSGDGQSSGKFTAPAGQSATQAASPNVRVLDQMRQKDGSVLQMIEMETPRGMVKSTRIIVPPEADPFAQKRLEMESKRATIEHTNAETAKAKLPPHYQPVIKDIVDPSDPSRMIAVDTNIYKGGSIGSPGVIAVSGKEPSAAKRQETVQAGLESFQTLTSGLRDAYNKLKENGDIASSSDEKSTVGNVMNRIQSSGLGQAVGKTVGTKSQDERNTIISSKNILLQSIMQATGMTARQLDSNVELKMWINSITDPSNTYESNMKILDNIEKFVSTKANAISKLHSGKEQPVSNGDKLQIIFEAQRAIAKGAPKDVVRQRLQSMGITNAGI